MPAKNGKNIVKEIIDAHGGADLWNGLVAVEAELSASGFLFAMKQQPVLDRVRLYADTQKPVIAFYDYPVEGMIGELIGNEEVRILDSDGNLIASRENPRSVFQKFGRLFFWDDLDFLYFAGYATWNYLVTPFLFLQRGLIFEELKPLPGYSGWIRLRVTFPDTLPVHCKTQVFHFDEHRHLRRLDYTAEVAGSWARAAHFCNNYCTVNGLKFPTRRRVKPLLGNIVIPGPTLVAIDVHSIHPLRSV